MLAAAALALSFGAPAHAIVGGAQPAEEDIARHVVLIVSDQGKGRSLCTSTAIARDLLLTAAHCVLPGKSVTALIRGEGRDIKRIRAAQFERHPDYDENASLEGDLALIKLSAPLPARIVPAELGTRTAVLIGERFTVAGYGLSTIDRDFGVLRAAVLMALRSPSENPFCLPTRQPAARSAGLACARAIPAVRCSITPAAIQSWLPSSAPPPPRKAMPAAAALPPRRRSAPIATGSKRPPRRWAARWGCSAWAKNTLSR